MGCENGPSEDLDLAKEDEETLPKQVEFSHEGQTFQVVSLFDEVLNYTNRVLGDEDADQEKVYHDSVMKPLMEVIDNSLEDSSFFSYETNIEKLNENTTEMIGDLDDINEVVKESLIHSAEQLPGHDITVILMPLNPDELFPIYHMEGISGVTSFNGEVVIMQLDPSFNEDVFKYACAHEYHHTVALKNQRELSESVLDMSLIEGKADTFAEIIYPNVEVPWTKPFQDEELETVIKTVQESPLDFDVYTNLQYGTEDYPTWSNYMLGYAIMESYLKNNQDISPTEWTKLSSEDIVKESEYDQLLHKD